jgi:hypothetical protein
MDRRVRETVSLDPPRAMFFASAEDTILAKLVWYRSGGEVSERQWRDVLGVIRATDDQLDRNYVRRWAEALDVLDLWLDAEGAARS